MAPHVGNPWDYFELRRHELLAMSAQERRLAAARTASRASGVGPRAWVVVGCAVMIVLGLMLTLVAGGLPA